MEGCFTFQSGAGAGGQRVCCSVRGSFFFKKGVHPMGAISFDGGFLKKIIGWGVPPYAPTMGSTAPSPPCPQHPWETQP